MKLAKQHIDVGFRTNKLDEMLAFWRDRIGLPYEELLKLGGGFHQHRLGLKGSVFKLNHSREPLPETETTGYEKLYIAADITEPEELNDPDGNHVTLVPTNYKAITHIGIGLRVRSRKAAKEFFEQALRAETLADDHYRLATTVFFVEEDPDMTPSGGMEGKGFRYLTVQVYKVDSEHEGLLTRGALEGKAPATLGSTARISFITDPDNNWIEISQRASLTGDLSPG